MKLGLSMSLAGISGKRENISPPPPEPPEFTVQPSLHGPFIVGDLVTFSLGLAMPGIASFVVSMFQLDDVDKRQELVGLSWDSTNADVSGGGVLALQVEASNSAGSVLSDIISTDLQAAPPLPGWHLVDNGDESLEIRASLGGPIAPLSSHAGGGLVQIGQAEDWLIDHVTATSFRCVRSIPNSVAPLAAEIEPDQIQIGV